MITETNPNLVPSLRVAIPSPQVKRGGEGTATRRLPGSYRFFALQADCLF